MLNDTASEMITPLLPLFLTATLGAGPVIVGLVEGLAEASASILKLVSGWLVDRGWNPKKLVVGGYTVSNVSRPLIGLALGWTSVMVLRFLDRVGKGLRTSPRDTLIAITVDQRIRGRAFGFHRAMDHTGAMLGPLLAFMLLQVGFELGDVFLTSLIPGLLVILLVVFALPTPATPVVTKSTRFHWRELDKRVRALILTAGGMALATPPEAFLILWLSNAGLQVVWVPLVWAAAHAVRAVISTPAGILSDHIGRMPVVIIGWAGRIVLLLVFALFSDGTWWVWLLFLLYTASTAFTEGAERALIGDFAPEEQRGTVYGLYHLICGLLALPGALLFGVIWQWISTGAAFYIAAVLTALSAVALFALTREEIKH
jgi:MFS family permease